MDITGKPIHIVLLCKVLDNYGDIGFTYRLVRGLGKKFTNKGKVRISLVVNNLKTLSLVAEGEPLSSRDLVLLENILEEHLQEGRAGGGKIKEKCAVQEFNNLTILEWEEKKEGIAYFTEHPIDFIIETFECGRPPFIEELLFSKESKIKTNIIMIDYLTAEEYAVKFHLMPSITRSSRVQKVLFMPGFVKGTGGLILEERGKRKVEEGEKKSLSILYFGYGGGERAIIKAINALCKRESKKEVSLYVAQGAGRDNFIRVYKEECKGGRINLLEEGRKDFTLHLLPYIRQELWDKVLERMDIVLIRGEDSLALSCVYGKVFLWQAYRQKENYQKVKVEALLKVMEEYFSAKEFTIIKTAFLLYNDYEAEEGSKEKAIKEFILNYKNLEEGYKKFSASLRDNGSLIDNLIEYMEEI